MHISLFNYYLHIIIILHLCIQIPAGVSIETIKEEVYPYLSIYQPSSPEIEEFYIPSFDDLDYLSIFPQYASILSANSKRITDKKEFKKVSKEYSISEELLIGGEINFDSYSTLDNDINENNIEEEEYEEAEDEEEEEEYSSSGRKRKQYNANISNNKKYKTDINGDNNNNQKKKNRSNVTINSNVVKKEDLFLEYVHPWSRQEDMLLVESKHRFFNNMEVVMDTIDMIPSVVSKHRSKKQCVERVKQLSSFSTDIESIHNIWNNNNTNSENTVNSVSIGILDAIKRTLQKNKLIPGKLGTAAQSEVTVSPHISHTQVAMSVGISKNVIKNPVEICNNILLKLQKAPTTTTTTTIPTSTTTAPLPSSNTTPKLSSNNFDTKLGTALNVTNNSVRATTPIVKPTVPVPVGTNKVLTNTPQPTSSFVLPINTTGIVVGNAPGQTSARLAHINQVVSQPNNLIAPNNNNNNRGVLPITITAPIKASAPNPTKPPSKS